MRRIDDLLLIKELNAKFFDHMILEQHLHEAVSPPSAAIEYDYERLELLGAPFYIPLFPVPNSWSLQVTHI